MRARGGDPLQALADLHRCLRSGDHAGAVRLVTRPAVADGLTAVAVPALRAESERAYRASVAAWQAERETAERRKLALDVAEVVAVLAEAAGFPVTPPEPPAR